MKRINLGLMAHVDAGKTTVTEQFLYHTGAIRSAGSVDKGTAHTDFLGVERSRGISVRAAVTSLETRDALINLIDTPGHADFSGEVERALTVIDGVVLIVSAVEGVQAQTEIIWEALRRRGIPVIFFINKIDRLGADAEAVLAQIRERLTPDLCMLYRPSGEGRDNTSIERQDIAESIAERSEAVLERYLAGKATEKDIMGAARELVLSCDLYPVVCGSAMFGVGIEELLDTIASFFPHAGGDTEAPVSGLVFKVEYDPGMGKVAHVRLYRGTLRNRDSVGARESAGARGIIGTTEKITQIRKFYGEKYRDTGLVEAGDIAALCGLSSVSVGDVIGSGEGIPHMVKWVKPLLNVAVFPSDPKDQQALARALSILNEEDPLLDFYDSKDTGELLLSITGMIQTEVLAELLKERFKLEVSFGGPSVIYKETPLAEAEGFDAYTMPKPCWAVLKFRIEPAPAGSGIEYSSEVPPVKIPYRYQNHVELSVPRALKQGLKGWEVTDIRVTLADGEYHNIHTHPLDFFVATPMALMKGLLNAGTALLEPVLSFSITVPEEFGGKVMGEIINMRGTFESPVIENGRFGIKGLFPAATSLEFPVRLASMTSGRGILATRFHSYQRCPEEVQASRPFRGVNPLDRSRFILWARNALGQFGSET